MNQIKLVSIAIMLQRSLGHSAGGIDLKEVPRLLEEAPLEAVEAACKDWTEVREVIKAAEAAMDEAQDVYNKAGGWGKAPEPLYKELKELQDAWYEAKQLESPSDEALEGLTKPWFEACGSPQWPGIFMPKLKYSTPKGSVNWDLTGARPRVWIERSKPGKAGLGEKGDEVVTYDFVSKKLNWSERAEARHLSEMAGLLYEVDPEARAIVRAEADRRLVAETKSAFRMAQLAIPVNDPEWDRKWNLLELGMAALDRAAASGTFYGPGMIEYFTSWEKAQVFLAA